MKKIKVAVLMISMIIIGKGVYARKGIELTIKYNADFDKYEVFARANFTQKNFILGPSQITISIPASVADEKLRIFNSDGGTWVDNTYVFAPKANTAADYHAISTLGAKTNFANGIETLLFYFTLPNAVNSSAVKLFENGRDPSSAAPGMKGGDFSNSISDGYAQEIYLRNYKEVKKKVVRSEKDKERVLFGSEERNLVLYPNTTKDDFKVAFNGVEDSEEVTMIIATEMGREIMKVNGTKADLMERTFKIPSTETSQKLVVRVSTQKGVFGKKLILDRE
jgi:hypothetical protein